MDVSSLSSDPSFFGKDNFVPFVGQVEDVDDPKRSGRVKVRCVGWHPVDKEGENGLSTEDLPWSRTVMPVTHAQQNRAGGKHGLTPGSWVIGFFADGKDANDGYVTGSFNHTALASEENNREDVEQENGTTPDEVRGFTKINSIAKTDQTDSGRHTVEEKQSGTDDPNDLAHDAPALDDSKDGECPQKESAFTTAKNEEKGLGNPESQQYAKEVADGLCGTLKNGRSAIQEAIKSMMPSGIDVLSIDGMTFDMNGNQLNMNAIMQKVSDIIASTLKDTIQTQKAFLQETANKVAHSATIGGAASRSPLTAQLADMGMSMAFDQFNSMIDRTLDQLLEQVMGSMQNINNQQQSSKTDDNSSGESGSRRDSSILDLEPIIIADAVINDIHVIYEDNVEKGLKEVEEKTKPIKDKIKTLDEKIQMTVVEDYECEEDYHDDIKNDYDEIVSGIQDEIDPGGGSSDSGGGGGGGSSGGFMDKVLDMAFTMAPQVFNKSGLMSLDMFTTEGCNPSDLYHTMMGYSGSQAGQTSQSSSGSGGGSGGGSESGKSSKRDKDVVKDIGFGGKKKGEADRDNTTDKPLPEETKRKKIKQSDRKKILNKYKEFERVDFYEPGRSYELSGEQVVNNQKTNRSRILVNDQVDPTENGIYITEPRGWVRSEDANKYVDYEPKKLVYVTNLPKKQDLYAYNMKKYPKIGYDDIKFTNAWESDLFTDLEKDAFDPDVDTMPDGRNADAIAVGRPSSDPTAAENYIRGLPNSIVITRPGKDYFFESKKTNRYFPSIFIRDYVGTPVPLVDRKSGEMVAIFINYMSFPFKSISPNVSILPDDSSIGLATDDPTFDVYLSYIYVENTGVRYDPDTKIEVIDKDREMQTAAVKPKIINGRIVAVDIINNGTGFNRIPELAIKNKGKGRGARLYPVMGVKVREQNPANKKLTELVSLETNTTSVNLFSTIRDINQ